jgi:predicted SprT family Zn-dependent metalloprotease
LHRRLSGEGLRDVFLHELAHVIQTHEHGRSDHGPVWRAYAHALGVGDLANGTRYHGSELEDQQAKWTYRCSDCGATIRKYRRPKWGNVPVGDRAHNRIHGPCRYKANRGILIRCANEQIDANPAANNG